MTEQARNPENTADQELPTKQRLIPNIVLLASILVYGLANLIAIGLTLNGGIHPPWPVYNFFGALGPVLFLAGVTAAYAWLRDKIDYHLIKLIAVVLLGLIVLNLWVFIQASSV